ncbi:MAG: glycosyltransferase family 4 protein [Candidatus Magasanikbacteria bacterium]|nr:glycosyltransferase family 4 protein [Candidatus Magasanikbacteria bacterium]
MSTAIDKRPHIVIATTAFAPFVGGAEIAVQELIVRLHAQFRFTIITARLDVALLRRDEWRGVQIIRVGWGTPLDKLWLIFAFSWHVARLRRIGGVQLVWAIMASYAGAAACMAQMITRAPYVLTLQEGDNLENIERRVQPLSFFFRQIFSRARGIQVIAPFLSEWATKLGAHVQPVIIPNGVSCELFATTVEKKMQFRAEVRNELLIPENASTILSISRLVEKNGISDLISAMEQLPEHHLILVGDGILRDSLEVQSHSIKGRVHFLGTQHQHDLSRFAAAADIFCRPAHSEGLGIVFLEALCMQLPVVATRVGGIPSIITDEQEGLLVSPGNISELVSALRRVTEDLVLYKQMQTKGLERVAQFSWELFAPKISAWLFDALKKWDY